MTTNDLSPSFHVSQIKGPLPSRPPKTSTNIIKTVHYTIVAEFKANEIEVAVHRTPLPNNPNIFNYKVVVLALIDRPMEADELRPYTVIEAKGNKNAYRVVLGRSEPKENFSTAAEALGDMMDRSADKVNVHYSEKELAAACD